METATREELEVERGRVNSTSFSFPSRDLKPSSGYRPSARMYTTPSSNPRSCTAADSLGAFTQCVHISLSIHLWLGRVPTVLPAHHLSSRNDHLLTYVSVSFSDIPQHNESGQDQREVSPSRFHDFSFWLMFSSAVENAEAAGQITLWIF